LQRLAEAFLRNTKPKTFCDSIPTHLHDFEDVFTKSSFDALPNWNCKPWDHVIKLIPDAKLVNCKVYPLALNEQKELDQFILENLQTGRIRPSKSLMALSVFFIKKKNGSLYLIQEHCALNAMMATCSLSFWTLSTSFMAPSTSQNWICDGGTRMCKWRKVTSERLHVGWVAGCSNHWWCSLALQTVLLPSRQWWMRSFRTLLWRGWSVCTLMTSSSTLKPWRSTVALCIWSWSDFTNTSSSWDMTNANLSAHKSNTLNL